MSSGLFTGNISWEVTQLHPKGPQVFLKPKTRCHGSMTSDWPENHRGSQGQLPLKILGLVALEHPSTPGPTIRKLEKLPVYKTYILNIHIHIPFGQLLSSETLFFGNPMVFPNQVRFRTQSSPCGSRSCSGRKSTLHHTIPGIKLTVTVSC